MIPLGNFTQIYKDTSMIIPKVEKEDGTIINNQFEILNKVKSFYEKIYNKSTSDIGQITGEKISEDLKNINHAKLTQEEQDNLEGNC